MASSPDGRALTEAHRRQQITIGLEAEREVKAQWGRLNPDDLDGTSPAWLAATSAVILNRRAQSAALARAYVAEFRRAEGVRPSEVVRVGGARPLVEGTLMLNGPIAIKRDIAKGIAPALTITRADRSVAAQGPKLAMNGGRDTVLKSSRRRRSRWRRVTDGDPCAFCAMLASRGPTYSAETVLFPLHKGRCGCTAEEVFGEWKPTPLEEKWDESYQQAAAEIKDKYGPFHSLTASQVTQYMRRLTPDLFHDGIPGASVANL